VDAVDEKDCWEKLEKMCEAESGVAITDKVGLIATCHAEDYDLNPKSVYGELDGFLSSPDKRALLYGI
jgi:hypothetical protein